MNDRSYPVSFNEIDSWRRSCGTSLDEARRRFAQFVALDCIGQSVLQDKLIFKGGNALRFAYDSQRSTLDLDFTAADGFPVVEHRIRQVLDIAFALAMRRHGVKMKCQRAIQNPKRSDAQTPTWQVNVGYQLPGDRLFADFESPDRFASTVVEIEISINDVVCDTREHVLSGAEGTRIKVCTIEDILGEKLRALLQQRIRNRNRRQDVYDIARVICTRRDAIDSERVAYCFVKKCDARSINATKSAFDDDIRARAQFEYDTLFDNQE